MLLFWVFGVFGTSIGSLVGGIIVQYVSWRVIFLINIPIGIIALILGIKYITEKIMLVIII